MTALFKHPEFRLGLKDMASVAPGLAAWGLMTGVAMAKSGMSGFEAVLMTLLVFAGSSQLAAIPLLAAGAPMWVILATSFCVNLRFIVFSAHLRAYLMHQPLWRRLVSGFFTADLSYVLFTKRYPHPSDEALTRRAQEAYLAGNAAMSWSAWVGPAAGHLVFAGHHAPACSVGGCGRRSGRCRLCTAAQTQHPGGDCRCRGRLSDAGKNAAAQT